MSNFDGAFAIVYNINMELPQIVIDTNVIIAAQRSRRGASAKLMTLIGTGRFEIHVSIPLVLEYEAVLLRQKSTLGLTYDDVSDLVDAICALSHRHKKIYFLWRPQLSDANDDFILELSVAAKCDCIVTHNKKDFSGAAQFGIEVLDPREFLKEIGELS